MVNVEDLKNRKAKLLENIEITEKKKKDILKIIQTLVYEFNSGRISKQEYDDKLDKALAGRTAEQWEKYYDDYLDYYNYQLELCEKLIRDEKFGEVKRVKDKSVLISRILIFLIFIILIGLLISIYFIFQNPFDSFFKKIGAEIKGIGKEKISVGETAPPEAVNGEILGENGFPLVIASSGVNYDEKTIQYQAVIGQNVKWREKISINSGEDFSLKLPGGAIVKSAAKIENGVKENINFNVNENKKFLFFGENSVEVKIDNSVAATGNAIGESGEDEIVEYFIDYETPAPEILEGDFNGKRMKVLVKGNDFVHYKNVLSFSKIPERARVGEENKIKIYQIKNSNGNEIRELISASVYDTNENGFLDYVEWITPRLSDDDFLIIIEISDAEHLDSEKNLISNIYEQVKLKDNIWSEAISDREYVKVYFKQELDNTNDITLYVRSNLEGYGDSLIEVYNFYDSEKLGEFVISDEKEYKFLLTDLIGKSDIFYLKINGEIKIDYIVDPLGWIEIDSCEDLQGIGATIGALGDFYKLTKDIDCSATNPAVGGSIWGTEGFNPLGLPGGFSGVFDGQGYDITNLYIHQTFSAEVGLFGLINGGEIRNLELKNVEVYGKDQVGGLAGHIQQGTLIKKVSITGNVSGSIVAGLNAGGLVGQGNGINYIEDSYSRANVTGKYVVGGLAGYFADGEIKNSYATGNATGGDPSSTDVGGLIGKAVSTSLFIENSYATGDTTAVNFKGGLIGRADGLITVSNSYWYNNDDVCFGSGVPSGWCAKTSSREIFYDYNNDNSADHIHPVYNPWDFLAIWVDVDNEFPAQDDYPVFRWGKIPISSCEELQGIFSSTEPMDKEYYLTNDIDCSATNPAVGGSIWDEKGFIPIGNSANHFTGNFNGNNHIIKNLYINRPNEDFVGLFGYVEDGTIKNVGLDKISIVGKAYVGGIVGQYYSGTTSPVFKLDNLFVKGTSIYGTNRVGGIAGYIYSASIRNSYSNVEVHGSGNFCGGLIGINVGNNNLEIVNCYSRGSVIGLTYTGGLVGYNDGCNIKNSYSAGTVNGVLGNFAGALEGGATITNSYCYSNTNNCGNGAVQEDTFADFYLKTHPVYLGTPVWDFDTIPMWKTVPNNYPVLAWQEVTGDILDVTECMDLTQAYATYELKNNIDVGTMNRDCIKILAEHITLDCKGFHIWADSNFGAYDGINSNSGYTTINNCSIRAGSATPVLGTYGIF